jgi:hypothetical protein
VHWTVHQFSEDEEFIHPCYELHISTRYIIVDILDRATR